MIWEVKPFTSSAEEQLDKYTEATGFERGAGKIIKPIKNMEVYGKLQMDIYFTAPGVINYKLHLDGKTKGMSVNDARIYVNDFYAENNKSAGEIFMDGVAAGAIVVGGLIIRGLAPILGPSVARG